MGLLHVLWRLGTPRLRPVLKIGQNVGPHTVFRLLRVPGLRWALPCCPSRAGREGWLARAVEAVLAWCRKAWRSPHEGGHFQAKGQKEKCRSVFRESWERGPQDSVFWEMGGWGSLPKAGTCGKLVGSSNRGETHPASPSVEGQPRPREVAGLPGAPRANGAPLSSPVLSRCLLWPQGRRAAGPFRSSWGPHPACVPQDCARGS